MAVIVVDVVTGTTTPTVTKTVAESIINVVEGTETPMVTQTVAESMVNVVRPGGTVANVQWGFDLPGSPVEGQIFIKVTQ